MRIRLMLAASAIALSAQPTLAQSTDPGAPSEEGGVEREDAAGDPAIVVTGSLVRRSEYQLSSPVDFIGREDLEAKAPTSMAEFVRDLPYNTGSAFASGRAFGNERGGGTINLRGLGASATLVLLNGRRQTQLPDAQDNVVDVNSLVPEIMLQRLEILKDGASATYGSDAVAGVVNFITNNTFEGLKLSARGNMFTYSEALDYRVEGMLGTGVGESGHITAAFGYYDQDPIDGYAIFTPSQRGHQDDIRFSSSQSAPGEFTLPTRNAAGQLTTATRRNVVDPTCGTIVSSFPVGTAATGQLPPLVSSPSAAVDCRYQFWSDNGSQSAIQCFQGLVHGSYDFSDFVRLEVEAGFADVKSSTSYTPGDTIGIPVTIPGHNPGNIYYRAVNSAGQPLYAVSSGVSAGYVRDGAEVFLPVRNAAGQVVLSPTPTVAGSGIPFYEDVVYSGRPLGSQCGLPTGNSLRPGECASTRRSVSDNTIMRAVGALSGDLTPKWQWNTGLAWSKYKLSTNGTVGVALTNELNYALAGLGGTGCNRAANTPGRNGCEYFNLFGNSALATPGSAAANSQAIIDYVVPFLQDRFESTLLTADATLSGELLELPAGPLAVAVGGQMRKESLAIDYDTQANVGNKANAVTQQDFDNSRTTYAAFVETNVPLIDASAGYLEFNGALRHEWVGSDLETTDPKIGLLYHTQDDVLTLRGSWGTSFVAPSLFRLFAKSAGGGGVNDCPTSQPAPCNGDRNLRIALISVGNLALEPERSEAMSLGAVLKPISGLSLEATWWNFDFKDRITAVGADTIVALGPFGTTPFPIVRQSSDPNVRSAILSVTTSYFNQASVETHGIDFAIDYEHDIGRYGSLNLNLSGTKTLEYTAQAVEGGPGVDGNGRFYAASPITPITPNTDLRINGRITWLMDGHNLTAAVRYYGPIDLYDSQTTLVKLDTIDSWAPIDISYTYTFDLDGRELQVGIGAQNVFAEHEPYLMYPAFQPFIPTLHDTRGRSIYAKASVTF